MNRYFAGSPHQPRVRRAVDVIDKQAREVNVFAALASGTIERRAVPGAIAIALASLIGGFSLGPEVPTGVAGGGIASWLRRNADEEGARALSRCRARPHFQ